MSNLLLGLITTISLLGLNREDLHQPLTDTKIPFIGHSVMSQTFTSNHDNLNRVSICLRNPRRLLLPLRFELKEIEQQEVIRTIDFSGGNIAEEDCTRFQFEPVENSAGRQYIASIIAVNEEIDSPHTGMYFEAYGGEDYVKGYAFVDEQEVTSDLHFKTAYRENIWTTVRTSLRDFVTRLGQDPIFLVLYLALLTFVFNRYRQSSKS